MRKKDKYLTSFSGQKVKTIKFSPVQSLVLLKIRKTKKKSGIKDSDAAFNTRDKIPCKYTEAVFRLFEKMRLHLILRPCVLIKKVYQIISLDFHTMVL